jgi:hypothetical protein
MPRPRLDGRIPEWNDTLLVDEGHVKQKEKTN